MARRGVSFKISLILAIPSLVLATGALLIWQEHRAAAAGMTDLSRRLFDSVSRVVVADTRAHLQAAVPASVTLADQIRGGLLDITSRNQLVEAMLPILRANPTFKYVSFSNAEGEITSVYRARRNADDLVDHPFDSAVGPATEVRLWQTRRGLSGITEREYRLESADRPPFDRRPVRVTFGSLYDARERPFFQQAVAAGRRVWTPPYLFLPERTPGITSATPIRAVNGSLLGVITIDFELAALQARLGALQVIGHGPHAGEGVVVLVDDRGRVLARAAGVGQEGPAAVEVRLLQQENSAGRDAATSATDASGGEEGIVTFEAAGRRWLGTVRRFGLNAADTADAATALQIRWRIGVAAPRAALLGDAGEALRRALWVAGLALLGSGIAAAVLAGWVAGPLTRIASDMDEAGRFKLDGPGPPPSIFREVQMVREASQRMKSSLAGFARYVPREVVAELVTSGREAGLNGELRELTLLFTDIESFTRASEDLTAQEVVDSISRYLEVMAGRVDAHGGTLDKFIGDAIMAFWNAPRPDPAHARHAVEAALAIRDARASRGEGGFLHLRTRIGLATGPAVVGNIGTSHRLNYTAMGDTVNLAARLESLNRHYGPDILVDEPTRMAADGACAWQPVDWVAVKGRNAGAKVYTPLPPAPSAVAATATAAMERYLARDFVGAARGWAEVMDADPENAAAATLHARAVRWSSDPPDPAWTGCTRLDRK